MGWDVQQATFGSILLTIFNYTNQNFKAISFCYDIIKLMTSEHNLICNRTVLQYRSTNIASKICAQVTYLLTDFVN